MTCRCCWCELLRLLLQSGLHCSCSSCNTLDETSKEMIMHYKIEERLEKTPHMGHL